MRGIFFSEIGPNNTCYWSAHASVYCHTGSVMVTFSPAPVDFGFSVYNISLISGFLVTQKLAVTTTDDVSNISLMLIL